MIQKKYLENIIKTMQKEFLQLVKARRNISDNTLELVSDGRIFTGKQAKDLKLIDEVGNENDALNWLKEEAGVEDNIRIRDLSLQNDISRIFNLSFLKKRLIILTETFIMDFYDLDTWNMKKSDILRDLRASLTIYQESEVERTLENNDTIFFIKPC